MLQLLDLKSIVLMAHLLGLASGLGGALLLQYIVYRNFVARPIGAETLDVFIALTRLVTAGLVLLWVSGLGLLAHGVVFDAAGAATLANPKIWAKVTIVTILTVNGVKLHRTVFPHLSQQVGRCLFDGMNPQRRRALATAGAVSSISWVFPMLFGSLGQLHPAASFAHGYAALLGVYGACALLAVLVARTIVTRRTIVPPPLSASARSV